MQTTAHRAACATDGVLQLEMTPQRSQDGNISSLNTGRFSPVLQAPAVTLIQYFL